MAPTTTGLKVHGYVSPPSLGLAPVVDHTQVWRNRTLTTWRAARERDYGEGSVGTYSRLP